MEKFHAKIFFCGNFLYLRKNIHIPGKFVYNIGPEKSYSLLSLRVTKLHPLCFGMGRLAFSRKSAVDIAFFNVGNPTQLD